MPVTLIVNNLPFEYPVPGDEPGWGQPATDWAIEVTDVLTDLLGPNDITQTSFTIQNNVSVPADITGLAFNTGQVRSAIIEYSIYRVSTPAPSGHAESGVLNIVYDNSAAPGSRWSVTQGLMNGNSGVTLTITDNGQFQYESTDIGATGYNGIIKFRARTLSQ